MNRCGWAGSDPEMIAYHDREWGVPVRDDRRLFEFLILEGAQAGLSWRTILKRREGYREAYDQFDFTKIARYGKEKLDELLTNPKIIRNRLKIEASVTNARCFIDIRKEYGSFYRYQMQFVREEGRNRKPREPRDIPDHSPESDAMSRDLRQRGLKFVGSTILYAYMQAVGMTNDHLANCFRQKELSRETGRSD